MGAGGRGISAVALLAIFYRALSTGRMGLTAPVAAVLSAAIPTVFGMFTEGLPGRIPMIGFFLAAVGLWLITRAEDGNTPEGIGLALLAGTGFAGFYLCVRQAGDGSAFWIATFTRAGGLLITGAMVLLQREFQRHYGCGGALGDPHGLRRLDRHDPVRPRQSDGAVGRSCCYLFFISRCHGAAGPNISEGTFHPLEIYRACGRAGGGADDCSGIVEARSIF